jgi:glycosyltransferase involved in cell wall biosynthesis
VAVTAPPADLTVSVIVPAYNAAAYLDSALASVAGQTRPADEVVVIDDCSTDATAAMAEAWSDRLPITLVRNEVNRGLGLARRAGIEASRGRLLALLDSDDVWFPDHLETVLAAYAASPGLVTSRSLRWFPGRGVAARDSASFLPVPPPDEQHRAILQGNFLYVGTLFERGAYDAAGGFADLRSDEDWHLWIRMIRNGVRVALTSHPTVLYRQRHDSLSAGDKLNETDIAVLTSLLPVLDEDEARVVRGAIRRREARRHLLTGYELARQGRGLAARRALLRAAALDRSLSGGFAMGVGGVTTKALVTALHPSRVVSVRDRRMNDPDRKALGR